MARTTEVKNLMVKPSTLTEARALTDSDAGKTYFLNAAGGFTVTLPSPRGGVGFRFIVKTAPTSANYVIATKSDAKIMRGIILTSDINAGNDAMREINGASNFLMIYGRVKVGDSVEMISDGTYWYVNGFCSIYDAMTIAEESKSPSISPSISPSASPSISISASPSVSTSLSPSVSPSLSLSASPSASPSISPSISPSAS